jgi:mRNA-degrading endonuclease RelE of RelBE toxin-antitoxin system
MYRVVVHRRAAQYLQRLPRSQRERIQSVLRDVALEPVRRPHVKPMVGEWEGYYRICAGDVRIIFWLVFRNRESPWRMGRLCADQR